MTLLGIIVSVASIMSVMTMGENIKEYLMDEVDAFGSDVIQVEISIPETDHVSMENISSMAMGVQITTLTDDDAEAIKGLDNVDTYNAGLMGQSLAKSGSETTYVTLLGSSADAQIVDPQVKIKKGRFFSHEEEVSASNSIVLGSDVAESLFGYSESIVGERVTLGNSRFRVVGVLKERGSSFGFNFDELIYLPYTTLQKKMLGIDYLSYITVRVHDKSKIDTTSEDIKHILRSRHDIDKPSDDDFNVMTMKEAQDIIGSVVTGVNILLIALASISLLVGGIGIMNIMIVSVEERIPEIGLRKAVGAGRKDIMRQFVIESIIISVVGSIIGIFIASLFISLFFLGLEKAGFTSLNLFIPLRAVLISIAFSVVAGMVFGVYPAKKASEVSPMNALNN